MAALRNLLMASRKLIVPIFTKEISACSRNRTEQNFSTSFPQFLKEIQVRTENDITVVEGSYIESDRKGKLLVPTSEEAKDFCPLCPNRLDVNVKYTDVLIISQFLRADGCVLPRRVTGLCYKAQKRLQRLAHQAQRAGLLPEYRPDRKDGLPRTNLHSNYKWRKYNTYFDD